MEIISRKERRKAEKSGGKYHQLKKGAALMGTTLTACSVVTPFMTPLSAEATSVTDTGAQVSLYSSNASAFITEIAAHAQPIANANDLYASVMIAQAIIESGWGGSTLSKAPYYNLFGIKGSYNGNTVYMDTMEFLNGKWVTMKEPFRQYPSFKESFADNAYTLRNVFLGGDYYYRGAWKSNTQSYRDATAWLTGRYATAPHYGASLNNVIETYNLTRFDTPASGSAGGGASAGSSSNNSNSSGGTNSGSSSQSQYYTVKSGDSVWLIANKYGISMSQLCQWNNIKNNFIYPGQRLIVRNGGSSSTGSSSSSSSNSGSSSSNSGSNSNNSSSTSTHYTVKAGDSVWLIANKYGISMSQLCQWNNIKNNFIYPGQRLIVRNGGSSSAGSSSSNSGSSNNSSSTSSHYTVKAGDSVWLIANKYGISMNQLCQWNNIKNNFIYPGQRLIVRNGGSSSTGSSSSASSTNTGNSNTGSSSTNISGSYTVKAGDSVWSIANKHGITMSQFRQWNNIKNDFVYPGQKVIVRKGASASSNTSSSASSSSKTYTVKSGDSLWTIAQRYNLSVNQLKSLNNLTSDIVLIGQVLKVK